jgi:hypothetical protein
MVDYSDSGSSQEQQLDQELNSLIVSEVRDLSQWNGDLIHGAASVKSGGMIRGEVCKHDTRLSQVYGPDFLR